MNTAVKIAAGVFIGFAGGFTAGFYFCKKMNEKLVEEVLKDEDDIILEEIPQPEMDQKTQEAPVLSTDPDKLRLTLQGKKSFIEADAEAKSKAMEGWKAIKEYSDEENANQLPVETEEGFDRDFIESIEEDFGQAPSKMIYPITFGEFENERTEYDKITIHWYEATDNEKDTWMDENEDIIADLASYVGEIDIQKLFEDTDANEDPDIRFVRNENYSSDYEIIRHHRSWSETVGGSD